MVMYHYGRPEPCQRLIQNQTYSGAIFDRYSRIREGSGAVAGHGIYMAGNPYSSAEYFSGGALQIVVEQGTPVIDVTDWNIRRRLERLGLSIEDIYNLPIDAVVHYSLESEWYVLKGPTGIRFEPMELSRVGQVDLARMIARLPLSAFNSREGRRFRDQAIQELLSRPRPLDEAIAELGKGLPATLSALERFSASDRLLALDAHLAEVRISRSFALGSSREFSTLKGRRWINGIAATAFEGVRTRAGASTPVREIDLKRLVFFSGRADISDWEINQTVQALSERDRDRLIQILDQLMNEYGSARRSGSGPSVDGLIPLGRLYSSLQQARLPRTMGATRSVSAVSAAPSAGSVRALSEATSRYFDLLRNQYHVRNPRLPRISTGPVEANCRRVLNSSIDILRRSSSTALYVGGLAGMQLGAVQVILYMNRQKLEHARSLCEAGQGRFENTSGSGFARCVCQNGESLRWDDYDDLPSRDQTTALCPSSN
jgi:hypothetical protein